MNRHTFKQWPSRCLDCAFKGKIFGWDYDMPLDCPECGGETELSEELTNRAHGVIGDDIPGGIDIRHGICHEDGSPKRYYSRTEIKRALNEKGLCIVGDTPGKPYSVSWSGKVDSNYTGRKE